MQISRNVECDTISFKFSKPSFTLEKLSPNIIIPLLDKIDDRLLKITGYDGYKFMIIRNRTDD